MYINRLVIENLRILESVTISPSGRANYIYGSNGSGKTTLLEAIYILARSKSFRTNNVNTLIRTGRSVVNLYASITNNNDTITTIGIKKTKSKTQVIISGKNRTRASEQVKALPLGIITSTIQNLIANGPQHRRRFINWAMFHVEPEYSACYSKYLKCLKQRNIFLHTRNSDTHIWNQQLSIYGEMLNTFVKTYLKKFINELKITVDAFFSNLNINIEYKQGWSEKYTLLEALEKSDTSRLNFTNVGPHTADISFIIQNKPIKEILSNGQQRIFAILVILTQIRMLKELLNTTPILLIDDITSELDKENLKRLLNMILKLDVQCFITSTNKDIPTDYIFGKVFHVEHGLISEVPV